MISPGTLSVNFFETTGRVGGSIPFTITAVVSPGVLLSTFSNQVFSASDDDNGHAYRISSVNSEVYASNRKYSVTKSLTIFYDILVLEPGALYCGALTQTQIASTISVAINSQT
jgi:hypothetical protein